jgi:hypothetical protein
MALDPGSNRTGAAPAGRLILDGSDHRQYSDGLDLSIGGKKTVVEVPPILPM